MRHDAALALVEVLRGNTSRAARWLHLDNHDRGLGGDNCAWAFVAYVAALRCLSEADETTALTHLAHARQRITAWSKVGFDRRSLRRARAAIELIAQRIDPTADGALDKARELADSTTDLLGDTGEDCVARVLAVHASADYAARLADAGDARATAQRSRALSLARPLSGLGAPAWDALVREVELAAAPRTEPSTLTTGGP